MDNLLNPISDVTCQKDQLGFDKYVDTLHNMFKDKNFKTPFCIGIYGRWGCGKTSFMRLLEKKLIEDNSLPFIIPVWFNPWRYEKEEHLVIPFLKTVETDINRYLANRQDLKKKILKRLENTAQKLSAAASAILYGLEADFNLGPIKFQFDVAKSVEREKTLAKKQLTQAQQLSSLYYDVVNELNDTVDELDFRIVVFIDDLDRCLPEKVVGLLESIKLFLDLSGYLFLIGVDKVVLTKAISYHYRFFNSTIGESGERQIISPDDYLDKMIQLPFEIPPIEYGRKQKFIKSLLGDSVEFKKHSDIIEIGVGDNPRNLKRFVNLLAFTVRLAETIKENVLQNKVEYPEDDHHKELLRKYFIPVLYVKWTIIVFRFPKVHREIQGNRGRLIELQAVARGEQIVDESGEDIGVPRMLKLEERLKMVLREGEKFPDNEWLLDRFVHLTESTVISEKNIDTTKGYKQTFLPGDMVRITKGVFLFGDDKVKKTIDYDYYIDVFPITNRQYKEFLDENKAERLPYLEESWAEGKSDQPVVLVSYLDAEEFCKWRSQKEGKKYRLPTEEEWEKAARGTDGREYPWGNFFDKEYCNSVESGVGETTEINRYSNITSPYGCYDMAGNVWEWTSSCYESTAHYKILRGGSYCDTKGAARCYHRGWGAPSNNNKNIGFRCLRILKK